MSLAHNIPIILRHGIGNKLNFIMNTLCCESVEYFWVNGKECFADHDDLFDWRGTSLCITSIREEDLDPLIEIKNEFLLKGYFWFQGMRDSRLYAARDFLKKIRPSEHVKKVFDPKKKYESGYAVRLLHPRSIVNKEPLIIPYGSFLTSDSLLQYKANPWASINTGALGGNTDLSYKLRNKNSQVRAVADWFSLFNCKKVFTYGTYPTPTRPLGISTFTDALFISGKDCENITL
jgi:hypothetical protein